MDKEEKARIKAAKKAARKNKRHFWENIRDSYKLVAEQYPTAKVGVWGSMAFFLIFGVVMGIITHSWIWWIFFGILMALFTPMVILSALISRAAYKKADGVPGATGMALNQLGRGWVTSEMPVEFTNDQKSFVFRAIGKPGVILVAEGPGDLGAMMRKAAKQVNNAVPSAPVTTIYVGHGAKQILLRDVTRRIKKLPKVMTAREVNDTAQRLEAMNSAALPIPKGVDPTKMRMSARSRVR